MTKFKANSHCLLIGSLPMENHEDAAKLVLKYTPKIPVWVQLPVYKQEGMIRQFLDGLPGFNKDNDKNMLNTLSDGFDEELVSFFEDYISYEQEENDAKISRFAFSKKIGKGFFEFLKQIDKKNTAFIALKGQVTGPITFGVAVKDELGKSIFYNSQLKEVVITKLAMNAKWQAKEFAKRNAVPIIFIDEPALSGFGTSEYITITKEDVQESIGQIVEKIHSEKGLAGIHVCANTQWDILLDLNLDIISFDAFSYFNKFMLYPEMIKKYLLKKKIIAWGIVPTDKEHDIKHMTSEKLYKKLNDQINELSDKTKIDKSTIISQSFITPSCGTGTLDIESAIKVLKLTNEVSKAFQVK